MPRHLPELALFVALSACQPRTFNAQENSASRKEESIENALRMKGFAFELEAAGWERLGTDFSAMKLVGLGEATHGTAEFTQARHQIFRYLVERHGYRVFVLEDEWLGGMRVTDALEQGMDVRQALEALTKKGTFLTAESLAMFEWMASFNSTHRDDPISVYGADMQNWQAVLEGMEELARRMPSLGTAAARMKSTISTFLDQAGDAQHFTQTATPDTFKLPLRAIRDLEAEIMPELRGPGQPKSTRRLIGLATLPGQWMRKVSADYLSLLADMRGDDFARSVRADQELASLMGPACRTSGFTCRDEAMAANIALALDIENRRGVYWAHNGHVARHLNHPDIIWANPRPPQVPVEPNTGSLLTDRFGPAYFPIITDFYAGSFLAREMATPTLKSWTVTSVAGPNSLHTRLHQLGEPRFALTLRQELTEPLASVLQTPQLVRTIGAEFSADANTVEDAYMTAVLPRYADAYLFFDQTSAHHPLP